MESSRRDLLNDVAELRYILKNNQITYYLRFGFTPKTSTAFPTTGVLFLLRIGRNHPNRSTLKNPVQNYHFRKFEIFFFFIEP